MTSETREIVHDQHSHPGWRFYGVIGIILLVFTALEIAGYIGETKHWYSAGLAAVIILVLSAVKFFSVVAYYMHLKFDNKLFTGIFVFPALLAVLVIGGMIMLFHVLHGEATALHPTLTSNEAVHGAGTSPSPGPE
ncbi:MAG TPA: cytochrome C oxidase subunit IV family protein [Longimicrobiaceae bacterium]|nr:cytochrome C oxidase subunit IV family protein [Longimicrobiaceae bacterium]